MKQKLALTAALIASLTLMSSCDDSNDNNGFTQLPTATYTGDTDMTIMNMSFTTPDTVSVMMDSNAQYAKMSFTSRTATVAAAGNLVFNIGPFAIDSIEVSKQGDTYILSRPNAFATQATVAMGAQQPSSKTLTGRLGDCSISSNNASIKLNDLMIGTMPSSLSFDFNGTKAD